jgi:serine-type D-Ala-D-Ala carboxypeptidase/endopeptidase (penicillin-binding protein 4)
MRKSLFILFLFVLPTRLFAEPIDGILRRSQIPMKHFAIWMEGEKSVWTHNADTKMTPASLSKIPTAAAVLSELGLGYQFETRVWASEPIVDPDFKGDIYLQGGGDPSLVSENYWAIVNELKRSGVRSISGKLYVDSSMFDEEHFSDSRQSVRVDRAYDAPVSALSFNWNSVNIFVRPGKKGAPAQVFADPQNDYIELKNQVVTGAKTDLRVERRSQKKHDQVIVSGTIALGTVEQVIYKSITHPDLWAGENFKTFLNQQGIEYKGTIENKMTPANAQLLVTFKSKPLRDIVTDMSKFSNNYVAEMLTKALSSQKPATLKKGVERIRQWLVSKNWKEHNFVFENPSGFSHDNKFRAQDLGQLLVDLRSQFSMFPEFLVALPISGVDGTLKKRLKDKPADVRAKTGYLDGIIGLAGYYQKNGEPKAFVFMYNGPTKYDSQVRDVFDTILRHGTF